jgi:hypothetical protein
LQFLIIFNISGFLLHTYLIRKQSLMGFQLPLYISCIQSGMCMYRLNKLIISCGLCEPSISFASHPTSESAENNMPNLGQVLSMLLQDALNSEKIQEGHEKIKEISEQNAQTNLSLEDNDLLASFQEAMKMMVEVTEDINADTDNKGMKQMFAPLFQQLHKTFAEEQEHQEDNQEEDEGEEEQNIFVIEPRHNSIDMQEFLGSLGANREFVGDNGLVLKTLQEGREINRVRRRREMHGPRPEDA